MYSLYSVESTTSIFQPIYPSSTRQVVPRQAVSYERHNNEQVYASSAHNESLQNSLSTRQHQHAMTNIGLTLAAPVSVMLVPPMGQINALMNNLYSSVNVPLTPPYTIQQNSSATIQMANKNLSLGITPGLTAVAMSTITSFQNNFEQRTGE